MKRTFIIDISQDNITFKRLQTYLQRNSISFSIKSLEYLDDEHA